MDIESEGYLKFYLGLINNKEMLAEFRKTIEPNKLYHFGYASKEEEGSPVQNEIVFGRNLSGEHVLMLFHSHCAQLMEQK